MNDLKFFIAYFVGDIQKMAEYYAKMCGIQDESSIKQLSDKIKEKVFYSGNNITNYFYKQDILDKYAYKI